MTIEERILSVLGDGPKETAWNALIRVFDSDRDAFYALACEGVGHEATTRLRELANLATLVRNAISETYEITSAAEGPMLKSFSGKQVLIPAALLDQVTSFLHNIDGKAVGTKPGRDYEGERISDAEARFKLGEPEAWKTGREWLEKLRAAKRRVLKLDTADLQHLSAEPRYVSHELLNCARTTVLAPTSVFKGLQRGDGAVLTVNDGWVFCGKPRQAYGNDGVPRPAPAGMVYVVYADVHDFVFDWDWTPEDPNDPGYPRDWQMRFGNPHPLDVDLFLDLPKDLKPGNFDATRACYSQRGDCIFCYMAGDESYAERINTDLTVFRHLQSGECTGFKIKNVRRILRLDKSVTLSDAPGLDVSVDSVLLATLKLHPDAAIQVYQVLIKALYQKGREPPKVKVPPEVAQLAEASTR